MILDRTQRLAAAWIPFGTTSNAQDLGDEFIADASATLDRIGGTPAEFARSFRCSPLRDYTLSTPATAFGAVLDESSSRQGWLLRTNRSGGVSPRPANVNPRTSPLGPTSKTTRLSTGTTSNVLLP